MLKMTIPHPLLRKFELGLCGHLDLKIHYVIVISYFSI